MFLTYCIPYFLVCNGNFYRAVFILIVALTCFSKTYGISNVIAEQHSTKWAAIFDADCTEIASYSAWEALSPAHADIGTHSSNIFTV